MILEEIRMKAKYRFNKYNKAIILLLSVILIMGSFVFVPQKTTFTFGSINQESEKNWSIGNGGESNIIMHISQREGNSLYETNGLFRRMTEDTLGLFLCMESMSISLQNNKFLSYTFLFMFYFIVLLLSILMEFVIRQDGKKPSVQGVIQLF